MMEDHSCSLGFHHPLPAVVVTMMFVVQFQEEKLDWMVMMILMPFQVRHFHLTQVLKSGSDYGDGAEMDLLHLCTQKLRGQ